MLWLPSTKSTVGWLQALDPLRSFHTGAKNTRREKHAWSFHTGRFLTLDSWITASELQVLWYAVVCWNRHGCPKQSKEVLLLYALYKRQQRKKKRCCRVHKIVYGVKKENLQHYSQIERADDIKFFNYFRMSVETFDELLSYMPGELTHSNTDMRDSMPTIEKQALTLR